MEVRCIIQTIIAASLTVQVLNVNREIINGEYKQRDHKQTGSQSNFHRIITYRTEFAERQITLGTLPARQKSRPTTQAKI